MAKGLQHDFKVDDRVRVASAHQWMPGRSGAIKKVEERLGNRFLIKFDRYELGMWHDEDGDPVLRLGENDLIPVDKRYSAGDDEALHDPWVSGPRIGFPSKRTTN